jgi:hypothetical protein
MLRILLRFASKFRKLLRSELQRDARRIPGNDLSNCGAGQQEPKTFSHCVSLKMGQATRDRAPLRAMRSRCSANSSAYNAQSNLHRSGSVCPKMSRSMP